jgi:protein arginine N-methyltransferase 1
MNLSKNTMLLHTVILNDRVRTSSFLEGIRDVVRPDDIVVDIGTGTGVLAIAAAHAGARHVYAIESGKIGEVAQNLFKANSLADRITLIKGHSTKINLPERADVLVSEIIGEEPLEEKVLEVMMDARSRFLKPTARLLPCAIQVFGLPVTIPETVRRSLVFTPQALQDWQAWYNIKFSPLAEIGQNSSYKFYFRPSSIRDWKSLSTPMLLADIDFSLCKETQIENTATITIDTPGELNGLIAYFKLSITPNRSLTTHPASVDKDNHWWNPVQVFVDPLSLRAGDQLEVTYKYNVVENTTWYRVRLLH